MRAFLTCLAFLAAAPAFAAWGLDQVEKRATENNVQVGGGCSGTIVNAEKMIVFTAYHCINRNVLTTEEGLTDEDGRPIVGPDGKQRTKQKKTLTQVTVYQHFWDEKGEKHSIVYLADIVARDQAKDVAILRIPERVGPVKMTTAATSDVPLMGPTDKLRQGDVIWHVGNPMMMYGSVTRGIFSGARNLDEYGISGVKFYVQYDGGLTGGSSGGALYDDATGRYVGIAVMVAPSATFLGLAVPMSDVWEVAAKACIAADLGGENAKSCPKPDEVKADGSDLWGGWKP